MMALFLLVSTTSWKVEKHYCMGRLMDVSFFVDADDCGMDLSIETGRKATVEKKSCCDDEVIVLEGQDDGATSHNGLGDMGQPHFFIPCVSWCFALFEPHGLQQVPHQSYIPPKIVKDIQLLDDVFLI